MNILSILSTLSGQKNLIGKASAVIIGTSLTVGSVKVLEVLGVVPVGLSNVISEINLGPQSLYIVWAIILYYIFKNQIRGFFKFIFPSSDDKREMTKDFLKDQIEIIKLKKDLIEAEIELYKVEKLKKEVL